MGKVKAKVKVEPKKGTRSTKPTNSSGNGGILTDKIAATMKKK